MTDAATKPLLAEAARMQSFIAFDFGMKRTGAAFGTRMLGTARPLPTIQAEGKARFTPMESLIAQWQPDALVVGIPFHPDGAKFSDSRESIFARSKFKEIDGSGTQRRGMCGLICLNTGHLTSAGRCEDRQTAALSRFCAFGWCIAAGSSWS